MICLKLLLGCSSVMLCFLLLLFSSSSESLFRFVFALIIRTNFCYLALVVCFNRSIFWTDLLLSIVCVELRVFLTLTETGNLTTSLVTKRTKLTRSLESERSLCNWLLFSLLLFSSLSAESLFRFVFAPIIYPNFCF